MFADFCRPLDMTVAGLYIPIGFPSKEAVLNEPDKERSEPSGFPPK
jgi:hypothetical protein